VAVWAREGSVCVWAQGGAVPGDRGAMQRGSVVSAWWAAVVRAVVVAQLSWATTCLDKRLSLDAGAFLDCPAALAELSARFYGEAPVPLGALCRELFCPGCPWRHACDATCGFCRDEELSQDRYLEGSSAIPGWPCPQGQLLDCTGVCRGAADCEEPVLFGYQTCRSWMADGTCDAGSRVSRSNQSMHWNCPMYGCDGHDCERCDPNPSLVPLDLAVPPHVLHSHSEERRREAEEEQERHDFRYWVEGSSVEGGGRSSCRDLPLSLSGKEDAWCRDLVDRGVLSCQTNLCDHCGPLAGACDSTCGLCPPILTTVMAPSPPPEPPSPQPMGSRGWALLLTTTIAPLSSITHTQRKNPQLRLRDYVKAITRWASSTAAVSGKEPYPLVIVESSGANLTVFRQAIEAARGQMDASERQSCRHIEVLSHRIEPADLDISRGKGVAEAASLRYAVAHSVTIRDAGITHVVKVTGRYFVGNLDAEIDRLRLQSSSVGHAPGPRLVVQSTPSPWTLFDGVLRSEVIGWQLGLENWLFEDQDERQGRPMERLLFERARELCPTSHWPPNNGGTSPGEEKEEQAGGGPLSSCSSLGFFHKLVVDETRNAENDKVLVL